MERYGGSKLERARDLFEQVININSIPVRFYSSRPPPNPHKDKKVLTGLRSVLIGLRNVLTGLRNVLIGLRNVLIGLPNFLIGSRNVLIGLRNVLIGLRNLLIGLWNVLIDLRNLLIGSRVMTIPYIRQVIIEVFCYERSITTAADLKSAF